MADIDVNKRLTTGQDGTSMNKCIPKFENDFQEAKNDIQNYSTQKYLYLDFDDSPKKGQKTSLQAAFEKFRKDRQECAKEERKMRKRSKKKSFDSAHVETLRIKFVEQAKKYFGVPYARKYWSEDTPEYSSPIFLDCCGLVRQVLRDLKKEFGFKIGPWNQAYMFDTLPIIIEKEEDMRPGDLVFMSGIYTNKKNKKQRHDMTHVEIWYGEGPKTIGSRWNNGKVQIFDSYRFQAKSFHSEEYYFRSIDTWLRGICKSFCPQHPWRRSKHKPGKKSIFKPDDDELIEEDEKASGSDSERESDNLKKSLTEQTTEKVQNNVVDVLSKDKACLNNTQKFVSDSSCEVSEKNYHLKTSNVFKHNDNMVGKKEENLTQHRMKDGVEKTELTQIQFDLEAENDGINAVRQPELTKFGLDSEENIEIMNDVISENLNYLIEDQSQKVNDGNIKDRQFTCQTSKGDLADNVIFTNRNTANLEGRHCSALKSNDLRKEASCMQLKDVEKMHPGFSDGGMCSSSKDEGGSRELPESNIKAQKGDQTKALENSEKILSSLEINAEALRNQQDRKTPKIPDQITHGDKLCKKQQLWTLNSDVYINHRDNLLLTCPGIFDVTDSRQEFHPNNINMSDESVIFYPSRRVIPDDNTSEDNRSPSTDDFSNETCDNVDKKFEQYIESLDFESLNSEISDQESFDGVDSQVKESSINNTSFSIYDFDIDSDIEFKMADMADACGDSAYDDEWSSCTFSDSDCHCNCDNCLQDAPAFQGLELWSCSCIDAPDCQTDLESEKTKKKYVTGEAEDGCLHTSLSLDSLISSACGQSKDEYIQGAPIHQDLAVTSKVKSSQDTVTASEFHDFKCTMEKEPIIDSNRANPFMTDNNLNQSNSKQLSSNPNSETIEISYELKSSRLDSSADVSQMVCDKELNSTCHAYSGDNSTINMTSEICDASESPHLSNIHDGSELCESFESDGISKQCKIFEVVVNEPVDSDNNQSRSSSKDSSKPAGGTKVFGNTGDGGSNRNTEEKEGKRGGGKRTPGRRPTKLPACCLPNNMMNTFYIGGGNGVALVEGTLLNMGWKRIVDKNDERYKLKWVECKSKINYQSFREGEQLVNHIPNCHLLTNKLGLVNSLQEYERVTLSTKGRAPRLKISDILPETYKLDDKNDRETFLQTYKDGEVWICKPTGMNQGKGIFLLRSQQEIDKLLSERDEKQQQRKANRPLMSRIVQRYIHNPLLLDGRKFDIRAYMLIANTTPYLVVYHKGYVRLSCMPYDGDDTNLTTHLTNQYIQKKDPNYKDVKEDTAWSMDKFNDYINEKIAPEKNLEPNWVYDYLTKQMQRMMLHCFNSVKHKLQCKIGYFDLYGLDFMVDTDMKVWMIEINVNPSLSTNCEALKDVIPSVVEDAINLSVECFEKSKKHQLLQPLNNLRGFTVLYCGSQPNAVQSRSNRSSSPSKESEKSSIAAQSTSKRRSGVSPSRSFVPRTSTSHTANPVQSKSGFNQESDPLAKSPYSGSILQAKQLQQQPKGTIQNSASKTRSQTRKSTIDTNAESFSKPLAKSSSSTQSVSKSSNDSKCNSSQSNSTSPKSSSDSLKSETNSKSSSANSTSSSTSKKSISDSKSPKTGSELKSTQPKSAVNPKSTSPKANSDSKSTSPKANSDSKSTSPKANSDSKSTPPEKGSDSKAASPNFSNESKSASSKSTSPKSENRDSPTGEVKLKLMHKSKMEMSDRGN